MLQAMASITLQFCDTSNQTYQNQALNIRTKDVELQFTGQCALGLWSCNGSGGGSGVSSTSESQQKYNEQDEECNPWSFHM